METPVVAPVAGTVVAVVQRAGALISAGQTLVVLDPTT